jgi:hypothetical protein
MSSTGRERFGFGAERLNPARQQNSSPVQFMVIDATMPVVEG